MINSVFTPAVCFIPLQPHWPSFASFTLLCSNLSGIQQSLFCPFVCFYTLTEFIPSVLHGIYTKNLFFRWCWNLEGCFSTLLSSKGLSFICFDFFFFFQPFLSASLSLCVFLFSLHTNRSVHLPPQPATGLLLHQHWVQTGKHSCKTNQPVLVIAASHTCLRSNECLLHN